ncbi:GAK5 protein, partial [Sylvietta virens]|nr:GAK5 protein [Sylvietta virens]
LDQVRNKPDVSLHDFVKVCARVGTEQQEADLLATTLAQQLQVFAKAKVKCFDCGGGGHVNKQGKKKPSQLCPRCKKGFHWSNECRSKHNKDGKPLPRQENSKRGSGSCAPPHNGIQQQQTHT